MPDRQPLAEAEFITLNKVLTAEPAGGRIAAENDAQAVMAWLKEYEDSSQTFKAYRRESERLLLWLSSQGLTLPDINRETLHRFEAFLADPQPKQYVGFGVRLHSFIVLLVITRSM